MFRHKHLMIEMDYTMSFKEIGLISVESRW